MFDTQDDIRDDIIKAGIDEATATLLARHAKPAVWLETRKVSDEAQIPIGATKLGGQPDLPVGVAWPTRPIPARRPGFFAKWWPFRKHDHEPNLQSAGNSAEKTRPLAFVAQINLAEMWAAGPLDADIPRQGVLSIFYDADEQPWGYDPQDRTGLAVLFHDGAAGPLARRDGPGGQLDKEIFLPAACIPHACMTPLPTEMACHDHLGLPDKLTNQVNDWADNSIRFNDENCGWAFHHVGGWPVTVQGADMQTNCALVHAGRSCGTQDAAKDPALAPVRATATDWLLLAQIGSDNNADMMWGDGGLIYIWIRRDDLKARRFENAWLILECT